MVRPDLRDELLAMDRADQEMQQNVAQRLRPDGSPDSLDIARLRTL